MLEFKKVNIFETYGKKVYSDQYGPINCKFTFKVYVSSSREWYDASSLFLKVGKTYERLSDKYQTIDFKKIFGRKLFIRQNNYYYRYNSIPQSDDDAKCIAFSEIKFEFNNFDLHIKKSDKKAFDIDVWVAENDNWKMRRAIYHQLKKGDFVYYAGLKCTCEVVLVNEPHILKSLFIIKPLNDEKLLPVNPDDDNVYWLPYEEHNSELAVFSEMKNELALSPYVLKEDNIRNVFWQPIEEASCYTVSIYKFYVNKNNECLNRLYHMEDCIVDRNCHFLTLEHLIGGDYIFVVSAENRGGEIIAKSRGIHDSGFPQFWQEDLR